MAIVLNGPAGVGKTTTARALAATADNGACIHGDALSGFVVSRRIGTVQQGLGYRNGAAIATNFITGGYSLVVFEYVFETPESIGVFRDAFTAQVPLHFFTLWAPFEVVLQRERDRAGRAALGPRVEQCYRTLEGRLDQLGPVVDTADRTVSDTVAEILDRSGFAGAVTGRADDRPLIAHE